MFLSIHVNHFYFFHTPQILTNSAYKPTMASHLQLLGMGIVDQLANLEGSLISMFLESSLRLAHVINADFFVLVETPSGGRRVAGSDRLCREFADGALIGNSADVRARLKENSVPITNEPLAADGHGALGPDASTVIPVTSAYAHGSIPRSEESYLNVANQINPFNSPSNHVDIFSRNSSALRTSSSPNGPASPGAIGSKRSHPTPTTNGNGSLPKQSRLDTSAVQAVNDDSFKFECFDDGDVEVIPQDVSRSNDPFEVTLFSHAETPVEFHVVGEDGDEEYDFTEIKTYLRESGKVACIASQLAVGDIDWSRQSKETRILGSIMYDLGKIMSRLVKIPVKTHPETKKHFSRAYDFIWAGIPGIEEYTRGRPPSSYGDHFRGLSLKAYLRCQMYSSFKNSLDRLLKKGVNASDVG